MSNEKQARCLICGAPIEDYELLCDRCKPVQQREHEEWLDEQEMYQDLRNGG